MARVKMLSLRTEKQYFANQIIWIPDYTEGGFMKKFYLKLDILNMLSDEKRRKTFGTEEESMLKDAFIDAGIIDKETLEMDAMAEAVASVCQALSQNGVVYTLAWTDGSELHREEISGTEELLQTIPQMYKSGADTERSGADWWLETYGRAEYGKVLYFARTLPGTIEDFTDGQICALLCDGTATDSRIVTITYKADTVMEDLQMVVL